MDMYFRQNLVLLISLNNMIWECRRKQKYPYRQGGKIQTPHRKSQMNRDPTEPSCCEMSVHCKNVLPVIKNTGEEQKQQLQQEPLTPC